MLLTRDTFQGKRHTRTENEMMEIIFHANGNNNKAGIAILIPDKIDFLKKAIKKDKKWHYVMM